MKPEEAKEKVVALIDERQGEFQRIAEQLFHEPETALREFQASRLLVGLLQEEDFRVEAPVAGMETAFRARYGSAGPSIAVLAEMDALPGLGHACGHNLIAAAAVGAAVALRRVLPGDLLRLTVLGTPAEEIGVGKVEMIRAGFFDDIEFAMMVHPSSRRKVSKEYLGLARIVFRFHGRASHAAAYPEEGVNALDAVIQTFNSINALRQQLRQDVRVHGIITDGGVAPNIIPGTAACSFYVRAEDLEMLEIVRDRVKNCAAGAALSTGCTLQVEEDPRVLAPFRINTAFADVYAEQLRYLGLEESQEDAGSHRGSSDIGNVSQVVPTIHPHVPIGAGLHIHTPEFAAATVSDAGEAAVAEGAKALALTAVELVFNEERRALVRSFFISNGNSV